MSAPPAEVAATRPRLRVALDMRAAGIFGLAPLPAGCAIAAIVAAAYFALRWLFAGVDAARGAGPAFEPDASMRVAIVLALLVGYTAAVGRWVALGLFRDRQELGLEAADADLSRDETPALARSAESLRASAVAGALGALLGLTLYVLIGWVAAGGNASDRIADGVYFVVVTPLLLGLMARAAHGTVDSARSMAAALDRKLEVDLLDLARHRIAGRVALRGALVWIIGVSISGLIFFSPDFLRVALPVMALTLVVAVAALVIPVRGARARIRAARRAELAAVDAQLAAARAAALTGSGAGGRLADLLAWRAYVANVHEWPFDASTFVRLALYLLIPLGSWLAGALVERLVNLVLD